jgi:hypothetical protein
MPSRGYRRGRRGGREANASTAASVQSDQSPPSPLENSVQDALQAPQADASSIDEKESTTTSNPTETPQPPSGQLTSLGRLPASIQETEEVLARIAALRASIISPTFTAVPTRSISTIPAQLPARTDTPGPLIYDTVETNLEGETPVREPQSPDQEWYTPFRSSQTPFRPSQNPFLPSQTPFADTQTSISSSSTGRANWTTAMEEGMMQTFIKARNEGLQTDGGFKSKVYDMVSNHVSSLAGLPVTAKQVKSKYEFIKGRYRIWTDHLSSTQSGWSLNFLGIPQAGEDVMNTYFAAHPDRKWCRHSKPKWIEYLDDILGERLATGSNALSIDELQFGEGVQLDEVVVYPAFREGSQHASEDSSTPSTTSIPVHSKHKRVASSSILSTRPSKLNAREYLGNAIEGATRDVSRSIDRMVKVLEDKQHSGQSYLQRALDILNAQFINLSPDAIIECSDVLSRENRAEVFANIRIDARAGYLNVILRREGLQTVV